MLLEATLRSPPPWPPEWNGNPYRVGGRNGGRSKAGGALFLVPFRLGRYQWLIDK